MKDKLLTMLGFAARARKISCGMNAVIRSVKSGKAKLALVASDISPKSFKEVEYFCGENNVTVKRLSGHTIDSLSKATGHRCGIISVNDTQFSDTMVAILSREEIQ